MPANAAANSPRTSNTHVNKNTMSGAAAGPQINIIAVTGSLRRDSRNTGLLRAAADFLQRNNGVVNGKSVAIKIVVPDFPLFNEDIEAAPPAAVVEFREAVQNANAVLFATTEYNYSVSAALKNAIDWASRGPNGNVWKGKPCALVSSGGGNGGLRSQLAVRQSAVFLDLRVLNIPEVTVNGWAQPAPFDANGGLIDSKVQGYVDALVTRLVDEAAFQQTRQ